MRGHRVGQHTAFNDRVSGERQENRPAGGRVLFVVDVHVSVFYPVRKKLQTLLQKKSEQHIDAQHLCLSGMRKNIGKKMNQRNGKKISPRKDQHQPIALRNLWHKKSRDSREESRAKKQNTI